MNSIFDAQTWFVLDMSFEEVRRSRVDMGHRDGALGRKMEAAEQQG